MQELHVKSLLPVRLDKYLMEQFPALGLGRLNKALRENKIKLNGKKQPLATRVQNGDVIRVYLLDDQLGLTSQEGPEFLQARAPAEFIYENDDLIVANKPAGIPVDGDESDTLLNRVLRGLPRTAHRGLLAVLAVPMILYPTLFGENGIVSDTAWMFLYEYLLAAYLRRYPENRLARLLQNRAAALALGLGLPLVNTAIRAVLETRGLTDGKAFQYVAYYRTALGALPNLLAALALFYLFKNLDLGCVRWVNALSGTTLGVYILHQVPAFRNFLWNGLLQAQAHHGSVVYTLFAIFAVLFGCAAVDAVRTRLVMRPLENTRLFTALCEKGDALAAKITADD